MRRSTHSDDDIRVFVQELIAGRPAAEVCRVAGVSERTLFRWRQRFAGLKPFAVRALRELEAENRRLRHQIEGDAKPADPSPTKAVQVLRSDLGWLGKRGTRSASAAVVGRYAALRIR